MTGLIEDVLTNRYGSPRIVRGTPFVEYRWNDQNESLRCVLYKLAEGGDAGEQLPLLGRLYGDAIGGSLLLGSAKLATLKGPAIHGLYGFCELQLQPEVSHAKRIDPAIEFFMDAANIWFYGVKDGQLYVYDSETGELCSLGSPEQGIAVLLEEWEEAKSGK